jgi:hypothetical protein
MEVLIEALTIFSKYDKPNYPTHCEHDELWIVGDYDPSKMEDKDVARLDELGFIWDDNMDGFKSYTYGSA